VNGVLVVDKPAGPTSHDIVDRVRRALGVRRVGHTGTLDPFATGVLPLCVGRATRLARFLGGGEKVYEATVRLGFATTTDDLSGEPLGEPREVKLPRATVGAALARLVGSFDQVPPAFSARHVGGRRLYELARRGEVGPRPASPVTVHAIDLQRFEGDELAIEVRCSAGTYIRALARDLGEGLGVGGHLVALRRTRSGSFGLEHAVALEDEPDVAGRLVPLSGLLLEMPALTVTGEGRDRVRHGREIDAGLVVGGLPAPGVERVRVLDESGQLLALAVHRAPKGAVEGVQSPLVEARVHPDVVLMD